MKELIKVHMLPDSKPRSVLCNSKTKEYKYSKLGSLSLGHLDFQPQNLYFTSDEKIKSNEGKIMGDWCWNSIYNKIFQMNGDVTAYDFKIVATTDKSLIIPCKCGNISPCALYPEQICNFKKYPQISQQFQEEYCKAGGIDEVYLEYELNPHIYDSSKDTKTLKLDLNNCVITHPVELKLYTKEEVNAKCIAFADLCVHKGIFREKIRGEFINWIKET
jgi:hypothetical protein